MFLFGLLATCIESEAGNIYKCAASDGTVTFSDAPCGKDPKRVNVDAGHSSIEVTEDRFAGVTRYRSNVNGPVDFDKPMTIQTVVNASDKIFTAQLLLTGAYRDGWKYLDCHGVNWLIDTKPVKLPPATHIGKAGKGGIVIEGVSQDLSKDVLEQFAAASKVEYKICNDEGAMSSPELSDLKRISQMLAKGQKQP